MLHALLRAMFLREHLEDAFAPRAHRTRQTSLERLLIDTYRVDALAPLDAVRQSNHRGRRVPDIQVHGLRRERALQFVLNTQTNRSVVTVTRQIHHDRHETAKRIPTHKRASTALLTHTGNLRNDLDQLIRARLDEFLTRIRLQDAQNRLTRVRGRQVAHARQHMPDLRAHHRNLSDRLTQGLKRVQANETVLTHHRTISSEILDAHIIQVHATVHRGTAVSGGQNQRARFARFLRGLTAQRTRRSIRTAHQTQRRIDVTAQNLVTVLLLKRVIAVAQERERIIIHPPQERGSLTTITLRNRRDLLLKPFSQAASLHAHRLPVLNRATHIRQNRLDSLLKLCTLISIQLLSDQHRGPRLDHSTRTFRCRQHTQSRQRRSALRSWRRLRQRNLAHINQRTILNRTMRHIRRVENKPDLVREIQNTVSDRVNDERHVIRNQVNNSPLLMRLNAHYRGALLTDSAHRRVTLQQVPHPIVPKSLIFLSINVRAITLNDIVAKRTRLRN